MFVIVVVCNSCDHSINARLLSNSPVEISDTDPVDLKKDSFNVSLAEIDNLTLHLKVTSGGGCRKHGYSLVMTPAAFMESYPVQANLYLRHDANDDPCDAIVTDSVVFDLLPIKTLYQQMYGTSGQINLNLYDFEQTASTRLILKAD
jgi:hypothetical protein